MPRYSLTSSPRRIPRGVLLAKTYGGEDPKGYWMSEKLDGIRATWDGKDLRTRNGNVIAAPAWFLKSLPFPPLDGELWVGRGRFAEVSSIVRKRVPVDAEWKKVRYRVFDVPDASAGPFERRHARVSRIRGKIAGAVRQTRVLDRAHMQRELKRVLRSGGEGLMLRKPGSRYVHRRSPTLLKVKAMRDAEARVVGHVPGRGKHAGRLGALLCETRGGRRFKVGTGLTDADRMRPPRIGSRITYGYQEMTAGGVTRFPVFLRKRSS